MFSLLKEQEKEIMLNDGLKQRKIDQGRAEQFQRLQKIDNFDQNLCEKESIRTSLKQSLHALQDEKCRGNIKLFEESLSKELGKRKQNNQREEKIRQLLWQTAPELRELRQKLLVAGVAKDQSMQIAEKQALRELEKEEKEALREAAILEKEKYEAEKKKKELQELQDKFQYHKDLDALRHFKKSNELANEEQLQRERNAIDEIKQQIENEEQDLIQNKIKKQRELLKQAQELQRLREEMLLKEKLKDKTQDVKVDEYRKAQELRVKEQEERQQFNLEQKLRLQEELLSCLENIYSEKLKQDSLRIELAIEEKEAAEKKKEISSEHKKMEIREELERVYEMQMYVKKQKQDMERKAEELYFQNLMAKLYEEDKLDLMSQQKQHKKKLEHMKAAQAMIEESRNKKAADRARQVADQVFYNEIESKRNEMVKEEKVKFLLNHAKDLLGYLPKGIFEDDKTIDLLGEEFQKFYLRKRCNE